MSSITSDSRPIKIQKPNFGPQMTSSSTLSTLLKKLPRDLVSRIVSYQPFSDQIHFEQTHSSHAGAFEKEWREKRKLQRYTFDWKMCSDESEKEKWNYSLTKALVLFLNKWPACRNSPSIAINTYEKYIGNNRPGIGTKFPLFGAFVEERLLPLMGHLTSLPSSEVLLNRRAIMKAGMEGYGGETYLHAITLLRDTPDSQIYLSTTAEWLKRAIRNGATLAADIPWGTPPFSDMTQTTYNGFLVELALEAHEKGHPGPFENLAFKLLSEDLFGLGEIYRNKGELSRAVLLYAEALGEFESLEGFESNVPALWLANMGRTKLALNQIDEADQFFTKALTAYAGNPTADVLAGAGATKYLLGLREKGGGHLLEATQLFTQADEYLTKAITLYGANIPPLVASEAICTKCMLAFYLQDNQFFKQVDEFCTNTIAASGNALTIEAKGEAARLKRRLKQFEAAKDLYKNAINTCHNSGIKPAAPLLVNFADVLYDLKEYKEADKFYTKAFKAYIDSGANPSADQLSLAAHVKDLLGQYKEAYELFTKAIAAYGNHVPHHIRADADALKAKLDVEKKNITAG